MVSHYTKYALRVANPQAADRPARDRPPLGHTLKLCFNKLVGDKDFVLYSRVFVIARDFYNEINYRRA
jgi:hypothetical protein